MRVLPSRVFSDLIGNPYVLGGRGPEAYDCAGLVLEVLRRTGSPVDAPATPSTERGQRQAMLQILAGAWFVQEHFIEPGCLVFFPGEAHVGVMIDSGRFLHTSSAAGESFIESIESPQWRHKPKQYYVLERAL